MTAGISGLSLSMPYGMTRTLAVDVRAQMQGDLKVVRDLRSPVQHSWDIPLSVLSRTERADIDAHFASMRGRSTTFSFTDPFDNLAYTVRYQEDSLQLSESVATRWDGSLKLIEVADFRAFKYAAMAFPTLTTGAVVQLPYQMGRRYRTQIGQQEDFSELTFEDFLNATGIQRWSVGGDVLTDAEAVTLLDFWNACGGPYQRFSFTEPETAVAYPYCRFVENSISHRLNEYNSNSVRTTVEALKET